MRKTLSNCNYLKVILHIFRINFIKSKRVSCFSANIKLLQFDLSFESNLKILHCATFHAK